MEKTLKEIVEQALKEAGIRYFLAPDGNAILLAPFPLDTLAVHEFGPTLFLDAETNEVAVMGSFATVPAARREAVALHLAEHCNNRYKTTFSLGRGEVIVDSTVYLSGVTDARRHLMRAIILMLRSVDDAAAEIVRIASPTPTPALSPAFEEQLAELLHD
jgi:hypothetical protein